MNILLVDDQGAQGSLLEMILHRILPDCRLVQELTCGSAMERLKAEVFDIVLMDEVLAGESGLNCLRRIRKDWPDLPVVMVTGYATDELRAVCFEAGADDFLRKEFMADLLPHVIVSATERRRCNRRVDADVAARRARLRSIAHSTEEPNEQSVRNEGRSPTVRHES